VSANGLRLTTNDEAEANVARVDAEQDLGNMDSGTRGRKGLNEDSYGASCDRHVWVRMVKFVKTDTVCRLIKHDDR